MNNNESQQEVNNNSAIPSPEVKLPTDKVTIINVDEIKPNTILVIKVDVENPMQKSLVAPVFGQLLKSHAEKLKAKNVTVILMTQKESMDLITEEEMNAGGWFKKEKSLIINPYDKF